MQELKERQTSATASNTANPSALPIALPQHRDLYYAGAWHKPQGGYRD